NAPLQEIGHVIPAAYMCQLMPEDELNLFDWPAAKGRRRQEDHRPQDPDQHRRGNPVADSDSDLLDNLERLSDIPAESRDLPRFNWPALAPEPLRADQSRRQQRERQWRAGQPQPWQSDSQTRSGVHHARRSRNRVSRARVRLRGRLSNN